MPLPSIVPRDRVFFELFAKAGRNNVHAAGLLIEMLEHWPDDGGLAEQITTAEHEGDKITHEIIRRLNATFVTPLDREDIFALASALDDITDDIEEAADLLSLYQIEAPMAQAEGLANVIVACTKQLATALDNLRGFKDLDQYWIEVHRLENEGDRLSRNAVASLFVNGIDPMVVIRWKDIFGVLERAIDSCERAANVLEGIVIKNS